MFRQLSITLTLLASTVLTCCHGSAGGAAFWFPPASPLQPPKNQEKPAYDVQTLKPDVKLGKVPLIELAPRVPLTKEKIDQIKTCIARLADIDRPDFGLSSTMSGRAFLPLPDQYQLGVMLLTNHQLKSSVALKTLIEMGPEALPYLLDSLGDKTPTKLIIGNQSGFVTFWFGERLQGNPASESEMKVLNVSKPREDEKAIESYTVKIGDVCFVAIGQIVGRGYQAVRYQPTASIVINSPTENAQLREQVRKIWSSDDSTRKLLNALLLDYATEPVYQGTLSGWDTGSELQIQAAMRLLYYYPKESTALIAERLRKLDVSKTSSHGKGSPATNKELDAYVRREVANGLRTDEFVKAVSWCKEPQVREAIRAIFVKTDDIDILLAALPGIEDTDRNLMMNRLQGFLNALPAEEGISGDGYNLLTAIAGRVG